MAFSGCRLHMLVTLIFTRIIQDSSLPFYGGGNGGTELRKRRLKFTQPITIRLDPCTQFCLNPECLLSPSGAIETANNGSLFPAWSHQLQRC